MEALYQLQEQEIPEAMGQLQDSHANLKKVADYCEGLYLQASDSEKKPALEETRQYTTQALASVAYQINTLATSFLSLLDLQAKQLVDMESGINHLSQTVTIHKEKVARREIGVLTTNKSFYRPVGVKSPGIIFPEQPEKPMKYIRKPLDYNILDSVGTGTARGQNPAAVRIARTPSVSSSTSSHGNQPQMNSNPPSAAGTLSRGNRHYGPGMGLGPRQSSGTIAPPVAPPTVPSHYMSAQQLQLAQQTGPPSSQANPMYGHLQGPPPPPPMMNLHNGQPDTVSPYRTGQYNGDTIGPPSPMSPPPPPMPGMEILGQDLPPPPPEDLPSPDNMRTSSFPDYPNSRDSYDDGGSVRNSLPLPPPVHEGNGMESGRREDPAWAPEDYMEKVVAIFDYEPQNDDELRFRENAILYVIKKNSDGWWEGVMQGDDGQPLCGLFPENYVESLL